jgi:hypothetical protein
MAAITMEWPRLVVEEVIGLFFAGIWESDLGCDCQAWLGRQKWRQLPLGQPEAVDSRSAGSRNCFNASA